MVHQGRRLAIGLLVLICSVNQGTLSADIPLLQPTITARGDGTSLLLGARFRAASLGDAAGFISAPGLTTGTGPPLQISTCVPRRCVPSLGPVMLFGDGLGDVVDIAGANARRTRSAPSALSPHTLSAVKVLSNSRSKPGCPTRGSLRNPGRGVEAGPDPAAP
jgi:hypothetical protein